MEPTESTIILEKCPYEDKSETFCGRNGHISLWGSSVDDNGVLAESSNELLTKSGVRIKSVLDFYCSPEGSPLYIKVTGDLVLDYYCHNCSLVDEKEVIEGDTVTKFLKPKTTSELSLLIISCKFCTTPHGTIFPIYIFPLLNS